MLLYSLDWALQVDSKCEKTDVIVFGIPHEKNHAKTLRTIYGFSFHFYVALRSESDVGDLCGILTSCKNLQIELCKDSLGSMEIERFRHAKQIFAKVSSLCTECLKSSFRLLRKQRWRDYQRITTYEGSTSYITQFLTEVHISAHSWIGVPMTSLVHYLDLYPQPDCSIPSQLCVCAFDIECLSYDCVSFPDASKANDTVEQIGLVLSYPFSQVMQDTTFIISLKELTLESTVVIKCESENHMLVEFERIINDHVHFLTSFNGFGFDFPFLIERCNVSGDRVFRKKFSTAAFGCQDYTFIKFDGVIHLDLLVYLRKEKKLESYKLDDVAALFLGETKHDVTPKQIFQNLKNGSVEDRDVIARYCIQDCILVLRLLKKLQILKTQFAMASVTECPLTKMMVSGTQARTMDLLARYLYRKNLLMPDRESSIEDTSQTYTGATVLEAKVGLYNDPVAGLDFASLYPSIMISQNLCVSTKHPARPDDIEMYNLVDGVYYRKSPPGVIPEILIYLWSTRKKVRKGMKDENDPNILENMEAEQLSYKLVMNSLYGFMGSSFTPVETKCIAKAVTFYGRYLLQQTQDFITQKYGDLCEIVYGDSITGETKVLTENGAIPIQDLARTWGRYRHANMLQQCLGVIARKQMARPDVAVNVMTRYGLQHVDFLIRRWVSTEIYMIEFDDGTVLRVTRDHCILRNGEFISAKELKEEDIV